MWLPEIKIYIYVEVLLCKTLRPSLSYLLSEILKKHALTATGNLKNTQLKKVHKIISSMNCNIHYNGFFSRRTYKHTKNKNKKKKIHNFTDSSLLPIGIWKNICILFPCSPFSFPLSLLPYTHFLLLLPVLSRYLENNQAWQFRG